MNCTDVAAILDDHALSRLSAAERCALDEHVTGCEPCALAWHAQSALLALPVPLAAPAKLLDRVLLAVGTQTAPRRRVRARVVIVGALLAAGAALAAMTAMKMLGPNASPTATPVASEAASADHTSRVQAEPVRNPDANANADADGTPTNVQYVDVEPFIAQRTAPDYPPEALKRKLNGDVTLRFTIDEHGAVKNVEVVRSSDAMFEAAAVAAVSQWKYLPRVSAGKRVPVVGIETIIRFTLDAPNPRQASAITKERARMPTRDQQAYANMQVVDRGIAIAWQRVAAEDFRGAELELDELRATYDLLDYQRNMVWIFYGYIYIQYGDYGRAIDAYEKAVATQSARGTEAWTPLAKLYFARHQYGMAFKTLLAYKNSGVAQITPEAAAMIEKLRALGVTEETL